MADYENEDEQLRAIKEWWNENGRSVVAGVVIGVAGLGGGYLNWREKLGAASFCINAPPA